MRTARILTTCVVAAVLLTVTVQSASAFVPCPREGNRAGQISQWDTTWPVGREDPLGITMCLGEEGIWGTDKGWLQIVDLSDGAKVRLISESESSGPYPEYLEPDTLYRKRTADDWYSWIRSLDPEEREEAWLYTTPDAERLFSTTNASYQKDSDNEDETMVPFPRWFLNHSSFGVSMRLREEGEGAFDANASKRSLTIGDPAWMVQPVRVDYFPRQYTEFDVYEYLSYVGGNTEYETLDATVAFSPDVVIGDGDAARRNFLGVYGEVLYLFTSAASYTNQEAIEIMQEIRPGMTVIQLDGGGSAQLHSIYGDMDSIDIPSDREVMDVLAIYRAEDHDEEQP